MRFFLPLLASAILAACTTIDTESLTPTEPAGEASVTGQVPLLTPDPTGATEQLTDWERENARAELGLAANRGQAAAEQVDEQRFQSDVRRLQAEAKAERERRLREIEGRDEDEDGDG
jgi:hypothetical protein